MLLLHVPQNVLSALYSRTSSIRTDTRGPNLRILIMEVAVINQSINQLILVSLGLSEMYLICRCPCYGGTRKERFHCNLNELNLSVDCSLILLNLPVFVTILGPLWFIFNSLWCFSSGSNRPCKISL